jgi:DNA-binding GntR family transcriptional regulator
MPPRSQQPPYRVVSAALRDRIDAGEWLPGEQLPTVRDVAAEYGVSVTTVRKALGILQADGLITVTPGWGVFRAS